MTDIVFIGGGISKQDLYTTSDIIAKGTNIEHRRVKDAIRKHKNELKSFGLLGAYQPESKGGRPQEIYRLNEPQATFLITLLKNTPIVVQFKQELVRQFYLMRSELLKRQQARAELKPIRRELTDAIKDRADLNTNKWAYKQYTDLAYSFALGRTSAQIKKERGAAPGAMAVTFLSAAELEAVSVVSNQIAVLIDLGMDYAQIKAAIKKKIRT